MKITAKTLDGFPVEIEFEDKGETLPLFDQHGLPYEGFTSWFCVHKWPTGAAPPSPNPENRERLEDYSQVSRRDAERYGDVHRFRSLADVRVLNSMNIDVRTVTVFSDDIIDEALNGRSETQSKNRG